MNHIVVGDHILLSLLYLVRYIDSDYKSDIAMLDNQRVRFASKPPSIGWCFSSSPLSLHEIMAFQAVFSHEIHSYPLDQYA